MISDFRVPRISQNIALRKVEQGGCVCICIFFGESHFPEYISNYPPPMNKSLIILESHCLSQTSINHDQFNEQKRLIESFVYSEQTQPFKHLFHHHCLKINWSYKRSSIFSYFFYFKIFKKCGAHVNYVHLSIVINVTLSFFGKNLKTFHIVTDYIWNRLKS